MSERPPTGCPSGFGRVSVEDLAARSVRSGAAMLAAQAGRLVLGVGGTVALARLLAPADFGLVAMAGAALGLLGAVRELGLAQATVQREEIAPAQVSALFLVNLAFGALLALAGVLLAPALARVFGEPRLCAVAAALAAGLLVGSAGVQQRALLQRALRFGTLAAVDLAALAFGTALAIAAALRGHGYWSLVALPLATSAAATLLLWLVCPWRPGRPARLREVRALLSFGGRVSAADVLQHASRNLDKILIGWAWGAGALGLYTKAYQLALLPVRQVGAPVASVAIPTLARLQRHPARYRRFYLAALRLLSFATLPPLAAAAVLAPELVVLALGEAWRPAAPLLAVLAAAAFVQLVGQTAGWLFVSLGHTRRMLRWAAFASAAVCASFALGIAFGALGVAVAYTVCVIALRVPHFGVALRGTPVTLRDVAGCVARPAGLALAVALAAALARAALAGRPPAVVAGAGAVAGAGVWAGLVAALPGARADLGLARAVAGRLRAARAGSAAARSPGGLAESHP